MKTENMKLEIPAWMHVLAECKNESAYDVEITGSSVSRYLSMTQSHVAGIVGKLIFFGYLRTQKSGSRKILILTQNGEVLSRACKNLIAMSVPVYARSK